MGEISDVTLLKLADEIPLNDVTRLGVELGFSLTDTKRFVASNHAGGSVTSQGTLQLLQDWRNNVKSASQRQVLKTAMERAQLGGIAERCFGSNSRPTARNGMSSSGSDEESCPPEIVQTGSNMTFTGTGAMENVNVKGQEANVGSSSETTQGSSEPATTWRKRAGKGARSGPKIKQQGSTITFNNTGPIGNLNVMGQEANVDSSKSVSQTATRPKTASKRKGGAAERDEDMEETGLSDNPQTHQQLSNSIKIFALAPLVAFVAYFVYFWLI